MRTLNSSNIGNIKNAPSILMYKCDVSKYSANDEYDPHWMFKALDEKMRKEGKFPPPKKATSLNIEGTAQMEIPKRLGGPLYVTPDQIIESYEENKKRDGIRRHEAQKRVIEIKLWQMEIRSRLAGLDPSSPKDSEQFKAGNLKLDELNMEIKSLKWMHPDLNTSELTFGPKFIRWTTIIKKHICKFFKKVKKKCKKHMDVILGVLSGICPVIFGRIFGNF